MMTQLPLLMVILGSALLTLMLVWPFLKKEVDLPLPKEVLGLSPKKEAPATASAPVAAASTPVVASAPVAAPADSIETITAVIVAAVAVAMKDQCYRIEKIQPMAVITTNPNYQNWSAEGRRQIFSSHVLR